MPKQNIVATPGKIPSQLIRVSTLPETARGVYANIAVIKHTPREFVIDFVLGLEGENQLVSRVIMSPEHTQAFSEALKINLERFNLIRTKLNLKDQSK